ncbi:calcium-binding protein [Paracoccus albus]|uniref:calcium-binding protein n=1 Tax=Paracoccus albus TaxID=3017784 RepID=UPI0022F04AAC|nr:hypothetical protein [Paracoccus albus]WBU62378.1 hypothetical protein PAF20_18725 [Paracoccus albus]
MAFNVITANSHNGERLEGGQYSADWIDGLGGNDTLVGYDGADVLIGNMGDDKIYAGAGDTDLDIVLGGDGNDHAYGGGGGDLMDGGAGSDMMGGGTGNDLMFGESGVGSLDLYSDQISHYGEIGGPLEWLPLLDHVGIDDNYLNSFPQAASGNDTMWGGSGRDMMFGGWGEDVIGGGYGSDLVVGNRDNDTLFGAEGNDVVLGGDEDDVMYGGAGNDILDGDETPLSDNIPSQEDLYQPGNGAPGHVWPHAQSDYLDDIEWVTNEDNHNGNDLIFGGDGDDWIHGREGADTLWGGTGDDLIYTGSDEDNDTDVIGFIKDHGNDTVRQFDAGEWPEGGNADWENGEDIIDLSAANYDGEFEDAVDDGAIVFDPTGDGGNGTVTIYTSLLGLANNSKDPTANTILITFEDVSDYEAFGANNILLNGEDWVDMTASFQNLEAGFGGGAS